MDDLVSLPVCDPRRLSALLRLALNDDNAWPAHTESSVHRREDIHADRAAMAVAAMKQPQPQPQPPAPGSHLGTGSGKGKAASTYAEDSSDGNGNRHSNGHAHRKATTGMDYGMDLSSMADWVPDPSLWDKIGGTASTADPTSAGTFNLADPVKTIEVRVCR